jgi:transcriptional regulator with XRE-family HTH domain
MPETRRQRRRTVADQLGERVARIRKERDVKVSELARAVGVSPSLISQIERGHSQPSVSTLFGLSEALGVPVDAFFATVRPEPPSGQTPYAPGAARKAAAEGAAAEAETHADRYLVKRDARATIDIEGGVRWERLTPTTLPQVEFLELVYAPGAESHSGLYRHPGTEMVLVLSGRLDIYVGFERYELEADDSMHFASSLPHRYVNPTDEEARAVTVILHDGEHEPDGPQRRV